MSRHATTWPPVSWNRMVFEVPSATMSPVPMACQFGPGLPSPPVPARLVPFSSQTTTSPLSFRQRMSDLPSPLKSPVPMACQAGPGLPRPALAITPVPFSSQIDGFAGAVLPQNVGEPIAVKIAGANGMPARPRVADSAAADHRFAPLISQMTTSPVLFCHRMSEMPVAVEIACADGMPARPGVADSAAADHGRPVHLPEDAPRHCRSATECRPGYHR